MDFQKKHNFVDYNLALNGFQRPDYFDVAVILGSGLGPFAEQFEDSKSIPYSKIPGFGTVTVEGHSGTLHSGKIGNKSVLGFAGRFHAYEGHNWNSVLATVHLAASLNVRHILITNAAGGCNPQFEPGDLMLIRDYLYMGQIRTDVGKRFPLRYDPTDLAEKAHRVALENAINLNEGTYCYVSGPTYETKAEVRAFRKMGADAIGMSTVPELQEATILGIPCLGISLITNKSTGMGTTTLTHDEVSETAADSRERFATLLKELILEL